MSQNSIEFWEFSVTVYGKGDVSKSCLHLQEAYELDINLLLFCYWYSLTIGEMAESTFDAVLEFSETWKSEIVQPLRNVRTWMKDDGANPIYPDPSQYNTLRQRIKLDELAAEKIQQEILEQIAHDSQSATNEIWDRTKAANSNIDKLLAARSLKRDEKIGAKLAVIANAIEELEF